MQLKACFLNFEKSNPIFKHQFGFKSAYSTNYTIVNLVENIKSQINDYDDDVCSVFRYLKKAFHAVDHQILLQKRYHYGIRGLVHNSFKQYLSNCKQIVFISVYSSEMISVQYPISQGSTLGAFLFLLYINDLSSLFNKAITINFADDTHLSYRS